MSNTEPPWRVQRILVGVLINYVELILWFSIIYRQLSLTSACQFAEPVTSMDQAFNLSFSTMTTIGYGKYGPDGFVSDLLAFWQVLIGVILLVLVVGSILALITGHRPPVAAGAATVTGAVPATVPAGSVASVIGDPATWLLPAIVFAIVWSGLFWLLGLHFCPPPPALPATAAVRPGDLVPLLGDGRLTILIETAAFTLEPLPLLPADHIPDQAAPERVRPRPAQSSATRPHGSRRVNH